jgi:hypothetical protein
MPLSLSLDNINRTSFYHVTLSGEDTYIFSTEDGIVYEVGFLEDYMLNLPNVYQFFIALKGNYSQRKDDGIRLTILSIIEEFFKEHDVLLDYICDTSDGKQVLRNRLFTHWFALYPHRNLFTLRSLSVIYEDIGFYASVLIKNDNSHYAECLDAIDNFELNIREKLK